MVQTNWATVYEQVSQLLLICRWLDRAMFLLSVGLASLVAFLAYLLLPNGWIPALIFGAVAVILGLFLGWRVYLGLARSPFLLSGTVIRKPSPRRTGKLRSHAITLQVQSVCPLDAKGLRDSRTKKEHRRRVRLSAKLAKDLSEGQWIQLVCVPTGGAIARIGRTRLILPDDAIVGGLWF